MVDVHGNLVLQHRMKGAPLSAIRISKRKAHTSTLVRMRTPDLLALGLRSQALYLILSAAGRRFRPMGRGIQLAEAGEVYASISVGEDQASSKQAIPKGNWRSTFAVHCHPRRSARRANNSAKRRR
jgi:uncharacterized protein GlcG (DUF336 family)